jgi:peptidoglycan/xylan/chitin deacetylase (PgdA/CDA1 family)
MMQLRDRLKASLLQIGRYTARHSPAARVIVLCYHSVNPAGALASPTPALFARHLLWLKEQCDVVPFGCVPAATRRQTNRPVVSVTFDDGYADNYEYAFPVLQRYGARATFFLTAGFVDKDAAVRQRLQSAWRSSSEQIHPLEWWQIREMRRAGMEFGAHSYGHFNLAELPHDAAEDDMRRAKDVLEERLGEPITSMAYPFGKPRRHFTSETVNLAAQVGYQSAAAILCRSVRAQDSPLAIPRFYVTQDSLATIRDKVLGTWDLLGYWQERLPAVLIRD